MRCLWKPVPAIAALLALCLLGRAHIERLTLGQIATRADNVVYGEITAKRAFRVDHPVDGPELFFTDLLIEGRSLATGRSIAVTVTYAGGWVDAREGVWNSEAPSEEETAVGQRVVVFYAWTDNMGGDVEANAIYAAHGGVYRTVDGPAGSVVMGRGHGYAIPANVSLAQLERAVAELRSGR